MTTTKIDLNKNIQIIEKNIDTIIDRALKNRVSYANSIQRALKDCIYHSLVTGKNDTINNLIKAMRKPRRLNNKMQVPFNKSQVNKVKQYIFTFAPFIIDNEIDGINEDYPTAIAKGTKQKMQVDSIEALNYIIDSLPLFINWKPKPKPKHEKTFSQIFTEWLATQNKKVENGSIELNEIEQSILLDLNESFNRLPIDTDDSVLAKQAN